MKLLTLNECLYGLRYEITTMRPDVEPGLSEYAMEAFERMIIGGVQITWIPKETT